MSRSRVVVSILLAAAAATAQSLPAGFRDTELANPTSQGSPRLAARIYYPAQRAGRDAPLRLQAGGYPTLVFLHGFTALGSWYGPVGELFARRGWVVFLGDTAQFDRNRQRLDGIATFHALRVANGQVGSFLRGAIDMARVGLSGHSMGGGNTVEVLAQNPGYRAGVCFAPVNSANASRVRVPVAVIHGTGDVIVAWNRGGKPLYDGLATIGCKALYLLDNDGTHTNVAGFFLISARDRAVWARCGQVAAGFLDAYVRDHVDGLEQVVGTSARAEPRLRQLELSVRRPALWWTGVARPGGRTRFSILAEPGPAVLLAAAARGRATTPFGVLELDPATLVVAAVGSVDTARLFAAQLAVPNDPKLIGRSIPFQAAGTALGAGPRLTNAAALTVVR